MKIEDLLKDLAYLITVGSIFTCNICFNDVVEMTGKAEISLINEKLDYLKAKIEALENKHVKGCKCSGCTGWEGDPWLVNLRI